VVGQQVPDHPPEAAMPSSTALRSAPRLPLVVTADPLLLDELLRLAAAGGTEVDVAPDAAAARLRWSLAPMVVVGGDQVEEFLHVRLPRRSRVVLVGWGDRPDSPWEMAEQVGADHVALLPVAEAWLVDQFADRGAGVTGRVVAVLGGRGGAGASVLAGGLAITGARGKLRTLLVDADPYGGGLDLVLGWEDLGGPRWPSLAMASGRLDAGAFVRALPSRGDLVMISFDRGDPVSLPAHAMAAALDAGRRARDLVVVDLPRHLDDAAVAALGSADHVFLVVPAELRATAAATIVAKAAAAHCAELSVVVRGPAPGRLRPREVARSVGFPLAGYLRPDAALGRRLERGEAPAAGRGPLADLCRRLIADLTSSAGAVAA
jgi:secretion/DNA translocation related CpaE-like protein